MSKLRYVKCNYCKNAFTKQQIFSSYTSTTCNLCGAHYENPPKNLRKPSEKRIEIANKLVSIVDKLSLCFDVENTDFSKIQSMRQFCKLIKEKINYGVCDSRQIIYSLFKE